MTRVRVTGQALGPMMLFALLALAQDSSVPPQPTNLDGATAYVYKSVGGSELRLHVFTDGLSNASGPRPGIVFFFGGGWTRGSITQFERQAKHLAKRGTVAIVADYRVFARHGTSPFEAIADAKSALRWVRIHSERLGVDPNRVVASGGSAGGHIALAAAVLDRFDEAAEDASISSKPNALVLFNPAVDTTHSTPALLGVRFGELARDASPMHHLDDGLPPTIIFHGKADETIPYADVQRFCAEARNRGDQCVLLGYEDATHGFLNPDRADGKWYRETLVETDRFLTKLGYLDPPAPTENR